MLTLTSVLVAAVLLLAVYALFIEPNSVRASRLALPVRGKGKLDGVRLVHYGEVDLVLCGHTHGGQVRLPFIGALVNSTRGTPLARSAGLFKVGERTSLFVSRGLGVGPLPVRLLCPSEVTCLALRDPSVPSCDGRSKEGETQ